ncbi:hypothetical protein ABPG77_009863 [Micractinium sp. CCAP 211/92]
MGGGVQEVRAPAAAAHRCCRSRSRGGSPRTPVAEHVALCAPLLLVLLLLGAAAASEAAAAGPARRQLPTDGVTSQFKRQGPAYAPGRLLVKLKPAPGGVGAISGAVGAAGQLPGLELRASLASPSSGSAGSSGRRLQAAAQAVGSGQAVGLFAIRDGMSVAAKVAQIRRLPGVAWATPDRVLYKRVLPRKAVAGDVQLLAATAPTRGTRRASGAPMRRSPRRLSQDGGPGDGPEAVFTPNDTQWSAMWHLQQVDAPHAWPFGMGDSEVRLCIIDTGMQQGHPDLPEPLDGWNGVPVVNSRGDVLRFPEEGDDDYHDWDDAQEHGSHVAGIAAAVGNNSFGVTGMAWQAGLLVCRVFNASEDGAYLSAILRCAQHCVEAGAAIVSMSLGSSGYDPAYSEVATLLRDAGILWVVPAGNDGITFDPVNTTWWEYPAGLAHPQYGFDNILAVAATGRDGQIASYSNRGPAVLQLAAPGSYILSTLPLSQGSFGRMSGTSMATPLVAAAAAQLAAAFAARAGRVPSYLELKRALLGSVDPFPNGSLGVATGGQLNVARAARLLLLNDTSPPLPPPSDNLTAANYNNTLQRYPGQRWAHYTESASFFLPLSNQTWEQCTQGCINNLKCGKYVFFSPPATTYIAGVATNCLLWSANADLAWKEDNASVESGLVLRTLLPPRPQLPALPPRPSPPPPQRRLSRAAGVRPRV